MNITIRKSTSSERKDGFPAIVRDGPRVSVPRYVVINSNTNSIWCVFGLPQGGETRKEAVFWAERFAGKNDFNYIPPDGWENIKGILPKNN